MESMLDTWVKLPFVTLAPYIGMDCGFKFWLLYFLSGFLLIICLGIQYMAAWHPWGVQDKAHGFSLAHPWPSWPHWE